jgi:hypothetical protein
MKKFTSRLQWLVGISFGALLVVGCFAPTRLFVVQAFQQNLLGSPGGSVAVQQSRAISFAQSHPTDSEVQIADFMKRYGQKEMNSGSSNASSGDERILFAEGDKLIRQFPADPSVCANVLRAECIALQKIVWRSAEIISEGGKGGADAPLPGAAQLSYIHDFITQAQAGERIDPQNAYFPLMLSAGYYAAHQDDNADAALLSGAKDTDWQEYMSAQENGERKIVQGTLEFANRMDGLGEIAVEASFMFPQYGRFQAVARMAKWDAEELEAGGNIVEGIRLRDALIHYGSLMRCDGRIFICNLVGIGITNIAISQPGGSTRLVVSKSLPDYRQAADLNERQLAVYRSFLLSHGHAADAQWTAQEMAAGTDLKQKGIPLLNQTYNVNEIIADIILQTAAFFIAGWALLAGCLWVIVAASSGIACSLKTKRVTAAAAGLAVCFVVAALLIALVSHNAIDIEGMLQMPLVFNLIGQDEASIMSLTAPIIMLGPLVLFLVVTAFVALARGKSVVGSVLSSSLTVAVPCVCVLLLLFSISVIGRARTDKTIRHDIAVRNSLGEGRFVFQNANVSWPALPAEPAHG